MGAQGHGGENRDWRILVRIGVVVSVVVGIIAIINYGSDVTTQIRDSNEETRTELLNKFDDLQDGLRESEQLARNERSAQNDLMFEIRVDIIKLKSFHGLLSNFEPPNLSEDTFWIGLRPDDAPYSFYTSDSDTWDGALSKVAMTIGKQVGFANIEFVDPSLLNKCVTDCTLTQFDYVIVIVSPDDVIRQSLIAQGWIGRSLDPYLTQAGHDPVGYMLLVQPESATDGFLIFILEALEKIGTEIWDDLWREYISD